MHIETECGETTPRVSVIMALNRKDDYLQPAIDSILDQTFQNYEFLVVVDSSCPGLAERVKELGRGDKRIRILTASIGGGAGFSRNLAIAEARGVYIAIMDGDDVSNLERLHYQADYLDKNPDVDVVGCRIQFIDQNSNIIPRTFRYYQSNKQIRKVLPYRDPLPHPGLMIRKSAIIGVQGYKYDHSGAEDYEMFIRMARNPGIKFYNLDRVLLKYRRHASQLTHSSRMKSQYADISGFLYTEFLRTHSPKYILGMFIIHPWVRSIRLACRKLLRGSDL
jgi:glycosyltransferase involved in cell wall biosynthesis